MEHIIGILFYDSFIELPGQTKHLGKARTLLTPRAGVANLFLQACQNIISDVKQVYTVPVTLNKTN